MVLILNLITSNQQAAAAEGIAVMAPLKMEKQADLVAELVEQVVALVVEELLHRDKGLLEELRAQVDLHTK